MKGEGKKAGPPQPDLVPRYQWKQEGRQKKLMPPVWRKVGYGHWQRPPDTGGNISPYSALPAKPIEWKWLGGHI